ncbi:hypothetical protein [Mumia sp. DW29H23]|uniref:hypothetical protein n=1 Tax=Mumia sp. DW29H23 TaxID=3421241 RepID=UPI003D6881EA
MRVDGWSVRPRDLYAAGARASSGAQDAATAASALVRAVERAGVAVRHPRLVGAFERARDDVSGPARRIPGVVDAVGARLRATAVTAAEADAGAVRDLRPASGQTDQMGRTLRRELG